MSAPRSLYCMGRGCGRSRVTSSPAWSSSATSFASTCGCCEMWYLHAPSPLILALLGFDAGIMHRAVPGHLLNRHLQTSSSQHVQSGNTFFIAGCEDQKGTLCRTTLQLSRVAWRSRGSDQWVAHIVQAMVLPLVSTPARKKTPNSPASRSSGSGALVVGSRRRSRCAAMLMSSEDGSPRAFTCQGPM